MTTAADVVFRMLLSRKPLSRADLARHAQVSRTYIANLTDQLLRACILRESGADFSPLGRPPVWLSWSDDGPRYIVGIVDSRNVSLGWFTPGTGYLHQSSVTVPHTGGATVIDATLAGIEQIANGASQPAEGIGVAIPGIVDTERGVVVQAINLNLRNVLFKDSIAQRFKVPVTVMRAPEAAAFAESIVRSESDLFYVDTGWGVGGCVVQGGSPVEGYHHSGGEIGHVVVQPGGHTCRCGQQGCLETLISIPKLSERFHDDGLWQKLTRDSKVPSGLQPGLVQDVVHWLSLALVSVVSLIDPKTIIIGPILQHLDENLADKLKTELNRHRLPEHHVQLAAAAIPFPAVEGAGMALVIEDLKLRLKLSRT